MGRRRQPEHGKGKAAAGGALDRAAARVEGGAEGWPGRWGTSGGGLIAPDKANVYAPIALQNLAHVTKHEHIHSQYINECPVDTNNTLVGSFIIHYFVGSNKYKCSTSASDCSHMLGKTIQYSNAHSIKKTHMKEIELRSE